MVKILKSPSKYIQGEGILSHFGDYMQGMGKRLLVIVSANGMARIGEMLKVSAAKCGLELEFVLFSGECTRVKIQQYAQQCRDRNLTAVMGVGGGKILDTAKGTAHEAGLPMVIVPTVCSSDSPCSSLSVLYDDQGVFDAYLYLNACPNIVMVDTRIIAQSPAHFLVAGMGDAMATWFEARACLRSQSNNQVGGRPSLAGTGLAAMCWKYLQENGLAAKQAVEQGVCTPALENIIEVNTYLSSIGFESGGLAAAHGIQKGFTAIPALHRVLHGELVAFCTVTQLVLENAAKSELETVLAFCESVGLPICFADMGYEPRQEEIVACAEKACRTGSTIYHLDREIIPQQVADALMAADAIGTAYKKHDKNTLI